MKESFEFTKEIFAFPDIEAERGEFERVAATFGVDSDTLIFLAQEEGKLVDLPMDVWDTLENTDSDTVVQGDWDRVGEIYSGPEYHRDWREYRKRIEGGMSVDAPIIMKYDGVYHLISGNTRLVVSRALGITPKVLLFEYIHDRTNEA